MASVVYTKGRKKGEISRTDDGRFVLDIDKRVKVSNHTNTFKDYDVMVKYLDWLFGKYEIRTEG